MTLVGPLWALEGLGKVLPEPSVHQAEHPKLSQPAFLREVLQPSEHLYGILWTHSNRSVSFSCWGSTELDTAQVGCHKNWVEAQNALPRPAGHAALDAAQHTVGFLGCKCIRLGRVEFLLSTLSLQGCSQSFLHLACIIVWDCPGPDATPCI